MFNPEHVCDSSRSDGRVRLRSIFRSTPGEMRILIADDHETIRKGICTILTAHFDLRSEDCVEASNGHEAIQKAVALKPDVIILDINMPVLGGFGAAHEIQRLLPGTPILFFTMHTGEQFVLEARKAGVQGFVAKDRAGEVLVDAVNALLQNETYF
jgi:DNA-binding NarL/FixJ family response regulator